MQQDTSAKGRAVQDNIPVSGRIGGVPRAGNAPGRRPGGALAYAAAHGTISNLVLVFTALLLLAVLDWHYYTDSRDNEALIDRRGTERAESLASLLRDNVAATIAQADALHGIARLLTAARMQRDTEAELDLRRLLDPAKGFSGLGVVQVSGVSADGALMWSSLSWNGASADLRDREHFQALIGNPNLELHFSSPVIGRTSGQQVVQFARPMHDDAGILRAITVVSLRSDILLRLCQELALTPSDTVSLVREDGTILMRRDMQHLGEKFPDWSPVEQLPPPGVSAPPEPGKLDKSLRYAVVRQVPGTPLYLRVAIGRAAQADALVGVTASLWRWNALLNATVFALAITAGLVLATQRRSARSQARAESLFESEAWFRGLFEDLADGVLVMESVDGGPFRIGFANAAASKILGAAPGTLNGQEWLKLIHPDDSAWVLHRAAIARSGESLPMSEYRVVRPDDAVIWLRISSSVTQVGGRVPRVRSVTTFHDITEEHERVAALAEARDRTDRVLNVIPGVFYQLTAEPGGPFVAAFVSPSVVPLLGLSVEQAMLPGTLSDFAGINLPALRQAALRTAGPLGVTSVEYPLNLPGRTVWVRDTMRLLPHANGRRELVGFIADASAEHEAREAQSRAEAETQRLNRALAAYSRSVLHLIRSESLAGLAQAVCDSIVDEPIYVLACVGVPLDTPGKPVQWLASAGRANGYRQELALSWSADVPEGRGPTGNAIRDGRPHVMRDALTDPGYAPWRDRCSQYDIRSSVTVPCRKGERVTGVLLIYSDIPNAFGPDELELFKRLSDEIGFAIALNEERSQMRGAELARQAAEENLSAAVLLGPGVLYRARVAADGLHILHVFGDTTRITGAADCSICGPASLEGMLSTPDMLVALRSLNGDAVQTIDAAVTHCGVVRWLRNAVRLTGRDASGLEVTGYLSEVTEEKRDQLHRQHVATLLTLGEMATGMAHELNQPLTSISFAAQNAEFLLGRQPTDVASAVVKLRKIISEANRASKLIEHMRVFARNERGAPMRASWRAALNAASEILSAKLRGCVLHDGVPDDLPDVLGAAIPMEQVLINLISNAVDAYDGLPATVAREVAVRAVVQDNQVLLRVSDRAGGIAETALARVFEPFFTTKAPGKGTGLGLALTFGTITDMGGTITAANSDGGAVFEIRLPVASGD